MSRRTYSYAALTCDVCGKTEIEPNDWWQLYNTGCGHNYAGYCTDMAESLSFCSKKCAEQGRATMFSVIPYGSGDRDPADSSYRPTWAWRGQ